MSLINFDERKLLPPLLGCVAGDLNYSKSGEEKGYENEPEVTRRMGWKQRETSPQTNRQPRRLTFANPRTSTLNDEELRQTYANFAPSTMFYNSLQEIQTLSIHQI